MESNTNVYLTTWNYSRKRKLTSCINKKRRERIYAHNVRQLAWR
jgi:hypothetical protein